MRVTTKDSVYDGEDLFHLLKDAKCQGIEIGKALGRLEVLKSVERDLRIINRLLKKQKGEMI